MAVGVGTGKRGAGRDGVQRRKARRAVHGATAARAKGAGAATLRRPTKPQASRTKGPSAGATRREAILAAALEEFSARGFAATRIDDVARRAGVAKGTIYLYFRDKDALFEELIRSAVSPIVATLAAAVSDERPVREIIDAALDLVAREIFATRRKDVIRLVLTEGARFPKLAEFYYREVLSRLLDVVHRLLQRAAERGELRDTSAVRFPQLIGAPVIVAILWNGLFERFEPLDVRAFMRAQLDLMFVEERRP